MTWVGLALALFSALRLVPGSAAWLPATSSSAARLPDSLGPPLAGQPATLHLAPGPGAGAALHLVTLTLAFTLAHTLCRRRPHSAGRLLAWLLAGGVVVLAVGYAHLVFDIPGLAGIYTPVEARRSTPFFSTLLNPNHLGAYCLILIGVSVSLRLRGAGAARELGLFVFGLAAAVGAILTLSRGVLASGLAMGVAVGLAWLTRTWSPSGGRRELAGRSVALGGIAALVLTGVIFLASDHLLREIVAGSGGGGAGGEGKLKVWSVALAVLRRAPWLGVGAGAFPDAAQPLQGQLPAVSLSHVENLPLQLLVDQGLILGLALLVTGGWFLWRTLRRTLSRPADLTLTLTLLTLTLQNFFDFNLSYAGCALPAAALLGILESNEERGRTRRPVTRVALLALLSLGLLLLLPSWRGDRQRVMERMAEAAIHAPGLTGEVRADLLRLPSSGEVLALAGAIEERRTDLRSARPWAEAAFAAAPSRFYPALLAARARQEDGAVEAAAEAWQHACANDRGDWETRTRWARELLSRRHGAAVVAALAARDPTCLEPLFHVSWQRGHYEAILSLARAVGPAAAAAPRILYWRGRAELQLRRRGPAALTASILMGGHPERPEGWFLEGLMRLPIDASLAEHLFRQSARRAGSWCEPSILWAEAAIRTGDRASFRQATQSLLGCTGRRGQVAALRGRFELAAGNIEAALRAFRQARSRLKRDPKLRLAFLETLVRAQETGPARPLCADSAKWPDALRARARALCRQLDAVK